MNIHETGINEAFRLLAEACRNLKGEKHTEASRSICAAVANIIAAGGSFGGTGQSNLMHLATEAGFACEFYAGRTIMVRWE